jgi:hypothetical protein
VLFQWSCCVFYGSCVSHDISTSLEVVIECGKEMTRKFKLEPSMKLNCSFYENGSILFNFFKKQN